MKQPRVAIIGGGIAGLYTAHQLEKLNIPYVLFEAKADVGGRILASSEYEDEHLRYSHDLGPTWIFPHHYKMQGLVEQLNLSLFPQYVAGDIIYHASQHAPPQVISDGQAFHLHRLTGGLYNLMTALKQQLQADRLKTKHKVIQLNRLGDSWQISVENTSQKQHIAIIEEYNVEHLVLALPPRLINEYLTPEYWASQSLRKAFSSVPTWMAGQTKFIATYKEPFWRHKNLSGQAFSRIGPMAEIHDASAQHDANFALFGFLGLSAKVMQTLKSEQIIEQCLKQLVTLFGDEAKNALQCHLKRWYDDDFVATDIDRNSPPAHPQFNKQIHQQECYALNLYLACSEFANEDAGYLEGAINAADEVLQDLTLIK